MTRTLIRFSIALATRNCGLGSSRPSWRASLARTREVHERRAESLDRNNHSPILAATKTAVYGCPRRWWGWSRAREESALGPLTSASILVTGARWWIDVLRAGVSSGTIMS